MRCVRVHHAHLTGAALLMCVCTPFNIIDAVNVDLSAIKLFFFFFVQNDASSTSEEHLRGTPRGRRQIRPLLEVGQLALETQSALKEEEERRRRLAEREKLRLEMRGKNEKTQTQRWWTAWCRILFCFVNIKEVVYQEIKMLLFTFPHVIPNLYDWLSGTQNMF